VTFLDLRGWRWRRVIDRIGLKDSGDLLAGARQIGRATDERVRASGNRPATAQRGLAGWRQIRRDAATRGFRRAREKEGCSADRPGSCRTRRIDHGTRWQAGGSAADPSGNAKVRINCELIDDPHDSRECLHRHNEPLFNHHGSDRTGDGHISISRIKNDRRPGRWSSSQPLHDRKAKPDNEGTIERRQRHVLRSQTIRSGKAVGCGKICPETIAGKNVVGKLVKVGHGGEVRGICVRAELICTGSAISRIHIDIDVVASAGC